MIKTCLYLSMIAACAGSLAAQSPAARTPQGQQPVSNILTVIGDNVLGLPCLDCLLGILVPSLGLPSPADQVTPGASYQVDAFLMDNNYTGPCTFTFALRDRHKNVIASSSQTLLELANTRVLVSSFLTIPSNAEMGRGSVSTTAVCGSTTTTSKSPTYISCSSNPPHCSDSLK